MPQQVTSASRWAKPVLTLGVLSAVAATTLGLAAPAAAESSDYLDKLQPRYTYLSPSQLLSAGDKACSVIHTGAPATDAVVMVSKDLGVSVSAAYEIVVNAINYHGC